MKTSAPTTTTARSACAGRSPTTSASSAPSASRSPSAASPNPNQAGQQAPRPPDPPKTSPAPLTLRRVAAAPGWGSIFGFGDAAEGDLEAEGAEVTLCRIPEPEPGGP